jgi:hypothetical protein
MTTREPTDLVPPSPPLPSVNDRPVLGSVAAPLVDWDTVRAPTATALPGVAPVRAALATLHVQRATMPTPPPLAAAAPIEATEGAATATVPKLATSTPAQVAVADGLAERAADGSVVFHPPADEPVVQRASDAPVDSTPPPPATTTAATPAPAGAPAHGEGQNVDRLAKQIYEHIRDQLKAELRLDRERWGRVTDLAR